jgi:hypothetical protein
MREYGFPRLYEDGTITICNAIRGTHRHDLKEEVEKNKFVTLGKRKKSFELTGRKKRLIRSSAIRQFITKKRNILFCTLTFPGEVTQKYANQCFSKYVENLKLNYALKSYIAVKENHVSGNPHFHCLFDIPFQDFKNLNRAWNFTFRDKFSFSANAFTTGKRKFVENIKAVSHYITKYISKAEKPFFDIKNEDLIKMNYRELLELEKKDQAFNELISTRIYFISENVLSSPKLIDDNTLMYLRTKFQHDIHVTDDYTIIFLKDFADLPENYLIPKRKKPKKKKIIPDSLPYNLDF